MHRFALLALCVASAFAQPNDPFKPKPPAEVDAALRARLQEFFDLHVKGQFRKAEELVAEESKDYFYTHNKPKYLSCEFTRIDYLEHFTKANALMLCEQYIMVPGFSQTSHEGAHPQHVETGAWQVVLVCGSGRPAHDSSRQNDRRTVSRLRRTGASAAAAASPFQPISSSSRFSWIRTR